MRVKNYFTAPLIAISLLISLDVKAASFTSVLELFNTMQGESSAWSVNVKQTSLSSNQVSQANLASNQQLATAIGSMAMSDRVTKATLSFHPDFGQPISNKCDAHKNYTLAIEADSQSSKDAAKLMSTYSSRRVGSRAEADREIFDIHRSTYCTVSEAKQGICELTGNGMQGWDLNYAGAFTEKTLAPEGEVAAYAYVSMITDHRAEASSDCTTSACEAAQSNQLAAAATSAMAANSLVSQITSRRVPVITGN